MSRKNKKTPHHFIKVKVILILNGYENINPNQVGKRFGGTGKRLKKDKNRKNAVEHIYREKELY